ncbi:MAG TPA: hypothetical protein VLU46_07710 [Thermoanaerobaculia bacterium]|nr:hypothetical protein [Thermoanaerobaculia bacterium]
MPNDFHFLVETIEPTLSDGMYARSFNEKHGRVGHLVQGRFRSHLIDSETYLLNVSRYIVLNPVRANFAQRPADWQWSSYRATAGLAAVPQWLTVSAILDRLDPYDRVRARVEYRKFVADSAAGAINPFDDLVGGICLGSADFVARVQKLMDERTVSDDFPHEQRVVVAVAVDDVRRAVTTVTGDAPRKSGATDVRLAFAELARSEARASLRAIGDALGIGTSGARYLLARSKQRREEDVAYATLVEEVRLKIRNCKLQL